MENPFAVTGSPWIAGFKLLALALTSVWLYYRATKQDIFLLLAGVMGLNALFAFIFLSGQNVGTFGILINSLFFLVSIIIINAILCSKLYYELPNFGIPKEYMVDPDKGVQLAFTAVTALVLFIVVRFSCGDAFQLIENRDRGLGLREMAYIIYFLIIPGIAYVTQYVLPWDEKRDTFLSGDIKLEAVNVFEIIEDISAVEKAAVPVLFYFTFFLLPYLLKDAEFKSDMDVIGLSLIALVLAAVIKNQFFKSSTKA